MERLVIELGVRNRPDRFAPLPIENTSRLGYAAWSAVAETWDKLEIVVLSIAALVQGKVKVEESVGGPVLIWEMAGKTVQYGAPYFFILMVMLSISLGVINLVPIPVLDGGHVLLLALELAKRGPLSARARAVATYIGVAIIGSLMVFVVLNDVRRVWPETVESAPALQGGGDADARGGDRDAESKPRSAP
jgi:regulator of sigma E protease